MLSDMIRGWDRATWYRAVRWTVKWMIVIAVVLYVLVDLHAKERAAEARLQRIEAAVDSVGERVQHIAVATTVLNYYAREAVQNDVSRFRDSLDKRPRTRLRDSTHRAPDTLLSLGPITVVRRP